MIKINRCHPPRILLVSFAVLWLGMCPGLRAAPPPPILPQILTQRKVQTAYVGGQAMFSVAVDLHSYTPLHYQWRFNGVDRPGATNQSLTLTNVQPADAGSYLVVVRNSTGPTLSNPALLPVFTPPQ